MPRYNVQVFKTTESDTFVEIEANNEDEAFNIAYDNRESYEYQENYNEYNPVSVEEIEEK